MRKATANDFIITTVFEKLITGLFVEQPKTKYTAVNKWTGDSLGVFDTFENARKAVNEHCK